MSEFTFRQYAKDDAKDLLSIRNAIFPPLTLEQWRQSEATNTASMAYMGEEVVGAIPMDRRAFQVAPGAIINTVFEHAVGTREDMRSKGVGAGMINAAREFLRPEVDTLMVYRGAERSPGYRFYAKTGHVDLIYLADAIWEPCGCHAPDCAIGGIAEMDTDREQIFATFRDTYGQYGGFPARDDADYWQYAMSRQIFDVLPQETYYIRTPAIGELEAYIIAGLRTTRGDDYPVTVQDAAYKGDAEAMHRCLSTLGMLAQQQKRKVNWLLSLEHPCREIAYDAGFSQAARHMMIMGQVINPQRQFVRVCADMGAVADLKIGVWTPTGDYILYEGPDAKNEVVIEAKDWAMHRLLCRRLDFASAYRQELVTLRNGNADDAEAIGRALPYNVWAYAGLDYV